MKCCHFAATRRGICRHIRGKLCAVRRLHRLRRCVKAKSSLESCNERSEVGKTEYATSTHNSRRARASYDFQRAAESRRSDNITVTVNRLKGSVDAGTFDCQRVRSRVRRELYLKVNEVRTFLKTFFSTNVNADGGKRATNYRVLDFLDHLIGRNHHTDFRRYGLTTTSLNRDISIGELDIRKRGCVRKRESNKQDYNAYK